MGFWELRFQVPIVLVEEATTATTVRLIILLKLKQIRELTLCQQLLFIKGSSSSTLSYNETLTSLLDFIIYRVKES